MRAIHSMVCRVILCSVILMREREAAAWPFGSSDDGTVSNDGTSSTVGTCTWEANEWTTVETLGWLKSLGKPFEKYIAKFEENSIDGNMLGDLTEEELKGEFGINNKYHLKKFMAALDKLKQQCADPSALRDKRINAIQIAKVATRGRATASVASVAFKELEKIGVQVDTTNRVIGEDLNTMLHDIMQEVVRLEATEKMTHFVIHQTAVVPESSGGDPSSSLMAGAKKDLPHIMDSKKAARAAFYDMKSGVGILVTAISAFGKAADRKLTQPEVTYEIDMLKKSFHEWQEQAGITMQNLFSSSEALLERTKERMQLVQVGGSAVQENMKVMARVTDELQDANKRRRAVIDSTDPKLQLAIQARAGALKEKESNLDSQVVQLRKEQESLRRIFESKDGIISQVEQFALQQNQKKQEWRDWHIRWCWANLWGPEMEKYDEMADRSIAAQDQERLRAEKAKEILGKMIEEHEKAINQKLEEKAQMQVAEKDWQKLLEAEGLMAAELEIATKQDQLRIAEGSLQSAMQTAGVSNPAAAVDAIVTSHKAAMLMSLAATKSQDVAYRVKSYKKNFDIMIERISGKQPTLPSMRFLKSELDIAAKALWLIGDGHESRMNTLDDSKTKNDVVKKFLAAETTGQQEAMVPTAGL